jgi:pimeloyl-ACP methyl ester carboxylesterase
MPIRGLNELRRMVDVLETRLERIDCPVLLLQGSDDPVVVPRSAAIIYERLRTTDKRLETIPADRHGILCDDIGNTRALIDAFFGRLASGVRSH